MADKEEVVELRPGGAPKSDVPGVVPLVERPSGGAVIRYSFEALLALQVSCSINLTDYQNVLL